MRFIALIGVFTIFSFLLFSEEDNKKLKYDNYRQYLGLSIKEAYEVFGAPDEISVFRGDKDWQDDVVFFYKDFFYLFWYQDHVWQVRMDYRYNSETYGLLMGADKVMAMEIFKERFGDPIYSDDKSLIYKLSVEENNFPVRIRFVFNDNKLSDMYIYRGDF